MQLPCLLPMLHLQPESSTVVYWQTNNGNIFCVHTDNNANHFRIMVTIRYTNISTSLLYSIGMYLIMSMEVKTELFCPRMA